MRLTWRKRVLALLHRPRHARDAPCAGESARIARGAIAPLSANAANGALILPGGYGAACLAILRKKARSTRVLPEVAQAITRMHAAGKPIGALCISDTIVSKLLPGVLLTIGSDADTAHAVQQLGSRRKAYAWRDCGQDAHMRVVTTPCYSVTMRASAKSMTVPKHWWLPCWTWSSTQATHDERAAAQKSLTQQA